MGCRRRGHPGTELLRVARTPDGGLVTGAGAPGRGAWLCLESPACVDLAVKRHAFGKALRGPVDGAALAALRANWPERARIEG